MSILKLTTYYLLLAAFCCCQLQQASAQNTTSSPYSRYGIGELQFGGFVKNLGMGGLSYGVQEPFNINFSNPASYSSLFITTFEVGVNATFLQLKNTKGTGEAADVSFGYFSLAFPVKAKKWGMSLGLLPYSNVGYSFTKEDTNIVGDKQNFSFTGKGGLNQFYIGNALNITKSLSVGVNAAFLFGTINQERRVYYPDGGYINSLVIDESTINDIYFSFGLQQVFDSVKLSKKDSSGWALTLGLTGAPSMQLRGKQSVLAQNYLLTASGIEIIRDTALLQENKDGRLVMPLSLGFGFAMKKGTRWLAGADFSLQNWQDYSLFGQSDSLANSWRIAAGAQWVPNDRSVKSYFKLVQYRLGFNYGQTYLNLNSSQMMQMGVSVGLSFPVKRSASMIHISAEAGKRGTTDNNLIEENYIKCSLGFTLNDRWFIKPKFD